MEGLFFLLMPFFPFSLFIALALGVLYIHDEDESPRSTLERNERMKKILNYFTRGI